MQAADLSPPSFPRPQGASRVHKLSPTTRRIWRQSRHTCTDTCARRQDALGILCSRMAGSRRDEAAHQRRWTEGRCALWFAIKDRHLDLYTECVLFSCANLALHETEIRAHFHRLPTETGERCVRIGCLYRNSNQEYAATNECSVVHRYCHIQQQQG